MPTDEQTNVATAEAATTPDLLPLHETTLIGLNADSITSHALLRTRAGRTFVVQTGQDTALGHVIAIGETYVVLRQRGKDTRIDLPLAA